MFKVKVNCFFVLALHHRFAGWVEGEFHVSDAEVSDYIEEPMSAPLDLSWHSTTSQVILYWLYTTGLQDGLRASRTSQMQRSQTI